MDLETSDAAPVRTESPCSICACASVSVDGALDCRYLYSWLGLALARIASTLTDQPRSPCSAIVGVAHQSKPSVRCTNLEKTLLVLPKPSIQQTRHVTLLLLHTVVPCRLHRAHNRNSFIHSPALSSIALQPTDYLPRYTHLLS